MSGHKITRLAIHATIVTILLVAPIVFSDDKAPIPSNPSQLNSWLNANIGKGLDKALADAEAGPVKIIKVRKDGKGDFDRVTAAVDSIPPGNTKRIIVWIGGGKYEEKIRIARTKQFVTFYGSPNDMPTLTFGGTAATFGTVDSASVIVEADYFMAANIIFANSAPKPDGKTPGAQAVALRVSGDKNAFYNCRLLGFQDTLCDDKGRHFFKDCYIEGTVDFIFGSGKSLYLNTELHVIADPGLSFITAQAREYETEDNGYSFVHCKVTGIGTGTYLGRAWKSRPKVVFAYSTMDSVVNPLGWSVNLQPAREKTVFYGELKNSGPGANPAGRASFTKQLSEAEAQPFISLGFIAGSSWILPPPKV